MFSDSCAQLWCRLVHGRFCHHWLVIRGQLQFRSKAQMERPVLETRDVQHVQVKFPCFLVQFHVEFMVRNSIRNSSFWERRFSSFRLRIPIATFRTVAAETCNRRAGPVPCPLTQDFPAFSDLLIFFFSSFLRASTFWGLAALFFSDDDGIRSSSASNRLSMIWSSMCWGRGATSRCRLSHFVDA